MTGAVSELTAASLLMTQLGYEVSKPLLDEVYDLLARDPVTNEFKRIQVKTLYYRKDKANAPVVYARKGNGRAYTKEEVDFIIGVDGESAYMFECRGITEYWLNDATAKTRWLRLATNTTTKTEAVI